MNFANRNASADVTTEQLMTSYGIATAIACGSALALRRVVPMISAPGRFSPGTAAFALRLMPIVSVASAGAFNAVAMRWQEAVQGVDLYDEHGKDHGKSVIAAKQGLTAVALTRIVLPLPVLLLPPYLLDALQRIGALDRLMRKYPRSVGTAIQTLVATACIAGALPLAIALFPQQVQIAAADVEPKFQGKMDAAGQPIQWYTYNKGL